MSPKEFTWLFACAAGAVAPDDHRGGAHEPLRQQRRILSGHLGSPQGHRLVSTEEEPTRGTRSAGGDRGTSISWLECFIWCVDSN